MVNELEIVIFISLVILRFVSNSDIIINPIKTDTAKNPLDFYISFHSCNERLNNKDLIIILEKNQVKFNGNSYAYSPNIFICAAGNDNVFLFDEYYFYEIKREPRSDIWSTSTFIPITHNYKYFGCLKKNPGPDNEITLYGTNGTSIFFSFIGKENKYEYEFSFRYEINTISCKYLDDKNYICAFDQAQKIYSL